MFVWKGVSAWRGLCLPPWDSGGLAHDIGCRNGMLFVEASAKSSAGVAHIFEVVAAKLTAPQLPTSDGFEDDAEAAAVPPHQI